MKILRIKLPELTVGASHWLGQKVSVPKVNIHQGVKVYLTKFKFTDRTPAFRSSRGKIIVYYTKILQHFIEKQPVVVCWTINDRIATRAEQLNQDVQASGSSEIS